MFVRHNDGLTLKMTQIPPYKDNQHGGRAAGGAIRAPQGGGAGFGNNNAPFEPPTPGEGVAEKRAGRAERYGIYMPHPRF